jgi:hypothetical protein
MCRSTGVALICDTVYWPAQTCMTLFRALAFMPIVLISDGGSPT